MKTYLLALAVAGLTALPVHAETTIPASAPESAMSVAKNDVNSKASKTARREAKKLTKAGWTVSPGALPLDKQLDRSYQMQYELTDAAQPKYIFAEAMSIGENYDAAKLQALELARISLSGQIQSEVTGLIESSVANKELAADEAASITESVIAAKTLIAQSLGRITPLVECYRTKETKNKEVLVRVAYSTEAALEATKGALRKTLDEKAADLHEKLDRALSLK